jgi:two-component system cell cycle sensor histidine kinase/response regulator CckA
VKTEKRPLIREQENEKQFRETYRYFHGPLPTPQQIKKEEQSMPVILLIDDEKIIRDSYRNFLEDYDYEVREASNGLEGLETFKRESADLVLLDLNMPVMDGIEVLKKLTASSSDIPIIVVSGTGLIDDVLRALRLGAWDYLYKPIENLSVLLHAVKKALERARLIRENRVYQERLEEEVKHRTEELEQTTHRLRESEKKFRTFTESAPVAIMIYRNGKWRYANPAARKLTGFTVTKLYDMDSLDIFHPDYREMARSLMQMGDIREEPVLPLQKRMELKIITGKNIEKWVDFSGEILEYKGETAVLVSAMDITERKNAEKEKANLEKRLQQSLKMESIGRLAGGIAHDFNNLLSPIMGYAQMLLMECHSGNPRHEKLSQILKASERARELTRQLLAFGRKQVLDIRTIILDHAITEFKKIMKRTIREDIRLKFKLNTPSSGIRADVSQIEQILMNLAINSQDAMPHGGELVIETLDVYHDEIYASDHPEVRPGHYVMLSVCDTGSGMDSETIKHVFEPFFTTKEPGKGTGLGLATVHGIVKQHGGSIQVYSELGYGTIFKIYFPRLDQPVEVTPVVSTRNDAGCGSETILLAEDEEAVRNVVTHILGNRGYTVIAAKDANECLQLARLHKGPIHMLLTDVIMPRMNGRELYQRLSAFLPDLEVLYMSGYTDNVIAHHGILDKGIHFLQKPVSIHTLTTKVRELLDKKRKKSLKD